MSIDKKVIIFGCCCFESREPLKLQFLEVSLSKLRMTNMRLDISLNVL